MTDHITGDCSHWADGLDYCPAETCQLHKLARLIRWLGIAALLGLNALIWLTVLMLAAHGLMPSN